jgi:ABC-type sugar transport system substrate-binding protein
MFNKLNLKVAVVAAFSMLALSGCASGSGGGQSDAAGQLAGKTVTIVTCTNANAWCSNWSEDTKAGLEAEGASVSVLTHNFDAAEQVQLLNQAISSKPDLILLHETADSKSVVPVIKKAAEAGVPIINIDGRAEDEAVPYLTAQVVHDSIELGRNAALNIVEGLEAEGKESGKVFVIKGTASMLITQDRMQGFNEVMAEYPQYEIVAEEDGNWDAVLTGQLAQQLFAKFGDQINAAYGMADYMAVPIIQAAEQAGLPVGVANDGLIVTGSNCTGAGNAAILDGSMFGSSSQDPIFAAEYTVKIVTAFLTGTELEPLILIPVDRVTSENAADFTVRCTF